MLYVVFPRLPRLETGSLRHRTSEKVRRRINQTEDLVSILIPPLLALLGDLAMQEPRPRILGCEQTHGDPEASESDQEAVSHSDGLSPEKLWQVEHAGQTSQHHNTAG